MLHHESTTVNIPNDTSECPPRKRCRSTEKVASTEYVNENYLRPVEARFSLCNTTCNILASMTPEFGFNGLGEVVFKRTYSRGNEDWKDVVIRVINGVMSIRKDHYEKNALRWVDDEWQEKARSMAISMFKMEWLPPGRGLWMMGTEFVYTRGSMALFNCFSRDTTFWTKDGLRTFQDFEDGDQTMVRGKNKWVAATIQCFGEQELWELEVSKGLVNKIIHCTANHRWLVKTKKGDGIYSFKAVTTESLEAGQRMQTFAKRTNFHDLVMCPVGIQHGIVFGDGTKSSNVDCCNIRLCGDKHELSKFFFTERQDNPTIGGLPNTWKDLPSLSMNKEYLLGFLAGWFATDGSISKKSCMAMTNSSRKVLEWARDALFKLDITTGDIALSREISPYDGSYKPLYKIHINRESLPESFLIRQSHLERFKPSSLPREWRVVSAKPTGRVEEVWCVSEPEFEEFTLETGILTKNCAASTTKDDLVLAAEWTMDALMNGVGVGFDTTWRGTAERPDKSNPWTYVVGDSREGWIGSLIALMCSYVHSERYGKCGYPVFDYSLIRPSGSPIKGFGGTASGPDPLIKLHTRVEKYFDCFCDGRIKVGENDSKPYSHTRLVADIFNAIGATVCAGNVRRCKPIDTLVFTKAGLKRIQDVAPHEDEVMTSDGYSLVTDNLHQGKQKLFKINTQLGESWCTPEHRMAVLISPDEYTWKHAKNIEPNDKLLFSTATIEGHKTSLPDFKQLEESRSSTLIIPDLSTGMAWFFGNFHGAGSIYRRPNGHCGKICVSVPTEESSIVKKCVQQIRMFGIEPKLYKQCNYTRVKGVNKQLATYFSQFKKSWSEINVPDCILQGTKEVRAAYLAGLYDADCTACSSGRLNRVFTSTCPEFLTQLQSVYASLGIPVRHRFVRKALKETHKDTYTLHIVGRFSKNRWKDTIGPFSIRYKPVEYSKHTAFTQDYHYPREWFDDVGHTGNDVISIDDCYDRFGGYHDWLPVTVLDTQMTDRCMHTFDLTVENNHQYICGEGLANHNSAEISLGSPDDRDFLNLKNYAENPERGEIGWMSNNSVVLKANEDFENFNCIPEMAKRILDNGEPGMINLHNIQNFGRSGKPMKDTASLINPCGRHTCRSDMATCC